MKKWKEMGLVFGLIYVILLFGQFYLGRSFIGNTLYKISLFPLLTWLSPGDAGQGLFIFLLPLSAVFLNGFLIGALIGFIVEKIKSRRNQL